MMGIVAILIITLMSSPGWAATYKWVDERGTVNFTQDYDSIPEKYRDQVKEIPDQPSTKPPIDERPQKTPREKPPKGLQKGIGKDHSEEQPVNKLRLESGAAEDLRIIVSL